VGHSAKKTKFIVFRFVNITAQRVGVGRNRRQDLAEAATTQIAIVKGLKSAAFSNIAPLPIFHDSTALRVLYLYFTREDPIARILFY